MADVAIQSRGKQFFREAEFLVFSVISFAAKSYLLIRLPYKTWEYNAVFTGMLLLAFYCYFRFRYGIKPPAIVVFCLAAAVGVDVLGNAFALYTDQPWLFTLKFDEFSHFAGSAFSLVPAMWLLRATTRRFGHKLPLNLVAFLSVCITFSLCAYYEILELWDEKLYTFPGSRLHGAQDSPNDLQWDLAGIITAALITAIVFKLADRLAESRADYEPVT